MLGAVKTILVCEPAAQQLAPCGPGQAPVLIEAFVVDPAYRTQLEALMTPVDFSLAASYWGLTMFAILSIWGTALVFRWMIAAIPKNY